MTAMLSWHVQICNLIHWINKIKFRAKTISTSSFHEIWIMSSQTFSETGPRADQQVGDNGEEYVMREGEVFQFWAVFHCCIFL